MSRYAAADGEGRKPYVVEYSDWGKTGERIGFGHNPTDARYDALGGNTAYCYATKVRRATAEDMERLA